MKKYTLPLALMMVLPFCAADAYEYASSESRYYTTNRPVTKYSKAGTTHRTSGYHNTITNNFYYTQPANAGAYKASSRDVRSDEQRAYYENSYVSDDRYVARKEHKKTVRETETRTQMRKYFLANPFFQPLEGRFGSVTDFAYSQNSFKFDMLNGSVLDIDPNSATYNTVVASGPISPVISAKQKTNQFTVKEDFSFGITDRLAIIGVLQYDKTKVTLKDWSTGDAGNSTSDSGLNIFGIGLQNRFVDTDEWIGMFGASFLHQKDTANMLVGEVKAGYKVPRTTIYGLGRLWYVNLTEGDAYGAYVKDSSGDWMLLSYKTDVKDIFYAEGGLGFFSVLNKYFTLNGELVYGYYDWHNQLNAKGAIGFQPGDSFALNLYASTAIYDSAKNKTKKYLNYDVNPVGYGTSLVYTTGDYKIKDYNEWKIGVQAILYF